MYTRGEMALRLGLFYTAASLSGAFGGKVLGMLGDIAIVLTIRQVSLHADLQQSFNEEDYIVGVGSSSLKDFS